LTEPRYLYCWFDTEYTTLDLERAQLLQVALVVSDDGLTPIAPRPNGIPGELLRNDGFTACLQLPPEDEISDHVRDHYQPLLEMCAREGRAVDEIDAYLSLYLDNFPETRDDDIRVRPTLAGNSIYADYFLARKFLPRFLSHLNYRIFDVTTLKLEWLFHHRGAKFEKLGHPENIRKYYRGEDTIEGDKHDAYYDVQASMAELAFYRSQFQRKQPT
jgi:oligoribonuclease (3'-5' exoribonuclease)